MDSSIHWLEPVLTILTSPTISLTQRKSPTLAFQTPLHDKLLSRKNDIDRITTEGVWDDAKKLTNPYEFIFLSLQRRMSSSISAIQPLSRSFFKMIEIWDKVFLHNETINKSTHTAEGPGGFLEAIQYRSGSPIPMLAMTLKSKVRSVPGWRKSQTFLQQHPDVRITYGADGTGDLYKLANQDVFASESGGRTSDLYTADGGFDFSADYNGQENTVQRLLVSEALAGLNTLKPGGTMILKLFDTKCRSTLEILWIVSSCFEKTGILKPSTSRPANSERYFIGWKCRDTIPTWIPQLFRTMTATDAQNGWDTLSTIVFSDRWIQQIQTIQEQVEMYQYAVIQQTFDLIRTPTREIIISCLTENIRHSREWCVSHMIPMSFTDISDGQLVTMNLEEVLAPFQASVAQMNLQGSSPLPQTHRVWTLTPAQRILTGQAWRTELPASVRGRLPSQTDAETPVDTQIIEVSPQSFPSSELPFSQIVEPLLQLLPLI